MFCDLRYSIIKFEKVLYTERNFRMSTVLGMKSFDSLHKLYNFVFPVLLK